MNLTETDKIREAADRLWNAQKSGIACEPVRDLIGAQAIQLAYDVQQINTRRRLGEGDKIVGRKIGLTSFAVQKQLGVDQPDYGILFESGHIQNGKIKSSELMQPKAETEIAFILGQDIRQPLNLNELIDAIDYAQIAIEVVGSRVRDWDISIADTIADNASGSHFILGTEKVKPADFDPVNCRMEMYKNELLVSEGLGKACMNNPLLAAQWLVNFLCSHDEKLSKGEIILSGALGPMVNITSGDYLEATVDGLGRISLNVVE